MGLSVMGSNQSDKIDANAMLDGPDMLTDDHNKIPTVHLAYQADLVVAAIPNKVHSGASVETGAWPILRKASTNGSGVATIYLTADGTSGTAAVFSTVYEDGIVAMAVGPDNYQITSCVLSGDKKSLAITLNYIRPVLGILTLSLTSPSGIEVRAAVWGK